MSKGRKHMKEDLNKKVVDNDDIVKAKEEAKELFKELTSEQLKDVAGGYDPIFDGDEREDLSLSMVDNEYIAGNVDVDGWAE